MVQEVIIQPPQRGKQPIDGCEPQQQPAWQQWHAVSCGRKQISYWTYAVGSIDNYQGLVKSWILEKKLQLGLY